MEHGIDHWDTVYVILFQVECIVYKGYNQVLLMYHLQLVGEYLEIHKMSKFSVTGVTRYAQIFKNNILNIM